MFKRDKERRARWYFGGVSATLTVPFTYPIDSIKIGIEMEQVLENITIWRYLKYVRVTSGIMSLYNGLFVAMHAQILSTTVRFGTHSVVRNWLDLDTVPLLLDVGLSATGGALAGFLKAPYEVVNTRMQADLVLELSKRRNYKSIMEAVRYIALLEGYRALFTGAKISMTRMILLNIGQICFYEESKERLMLSTAFNDTFKTHLVASSISAIAATVLTQPFDVVRTKFLVNTEDYKTIWNAVKHQAHISLLGFYRGSLLTFIKLGPQTVMTFIILEQLRLHFGFYPKCVLVYENPNFWTRTYRRIFRIKPPPPVKKCDP